MGVTKQRIKTIITHECQVKGIPSEYIQAACEHAEALYNKIDSFPTSVLSGVKLAEELYERRSEKLNAGREKKITGK